MCTKLNGISMNYLLSFLNIYAYISIKRSNSIIKNTQKHTSCNTAWIVGSINGFLSSLDFIHITLSHDLVSYARKCLYPKIKVVQVKVNFRSLKRNTHTHEHSTFFIKLSPCHLRTKIYTTTCLTGRLWIIVKEQLMQTTYKCRAQCPMVAFSTLISLHTHFLRLFIIKK